MSLSSSNRKYQPLPLLSYFYAVVCLRCLLHHTLSLIAYTFLGTKREFVFIISVQFMISENIRIRFGLKIVFVYLYITSSHYHHCANLSEDIELKCLSDIFCRVCKIRHILSVIHCTICGIVCFHFTHFPCDDYDNIYIYTHTLFYYHHQIGSMNYYPLFRVNSWNNGMRCMAFYILIRLISHERIHFRPFGKCMQCEFESGMINW